MDIEVVARIVSAGTGHLKVHVCNQRETPSGGFLFLRAEEEACRFRHGRNGSFVSQRADSCYGFRIGEQQGGWTGFGSISSARV
jgi:hypothetical protein